MWFDFTVASNKLITRSDRKIATFSGGGLTASASGQFSSTVYFDNALGLPAKAVGNAGQSYTMGFDGNGNTKTLTDATGRSVVNTYDAQNRLASTQLPDTGKTIFRGGPIRLNTELISISGTRSVKLPVESPAAMRSRTHPGSWRRARSADGGCCRTQ